MKQKGGPSGGVAEGNNIRGTKLRGVIRILSFAEIAIKKETHFIILRFFCCLRLLLWFLEGVNT